MNDSEHDEDPLAGSAWSRPETVAGFVRAAPNAELLRLATAELPRAPGGRALDIGCGAGRNAVPLAALGWQVLGVELSLPMARAAAARARTEQLPLQVALAPMDALPARDRSFDLVVAHGIWNLARSADEFRRAVREAARAAAKGAALFVFTFSRHTLAADAQPVSGEPFVFTQFSGEPQCFLTDTQLVAELREAGFTADPGIPLRELNRPAAGAMRTGNAPVIYEDVFRYTSSPR
jgi:SAM-dependent methyltransferase